MTIAMTATDLDMTVDMPFPTVQYSERMAIGRLTSRMLQSTGLIAAGHLKEPDAPTLLMLRLPPLMRWLAAVRLRPAVLRLAGLPHPRTAALPG